jgi:hypothetical protein
MITRHVDARTPGDALQNGAVLTVDGNDLAAPSGAGGRHETARHDERLLIGERDALPFG